jgi:hypothetical protein
MAIGFAARQRLGLRRKIEKPLPANEQVGDNAGRAAVETCVRRLLAISGVSRAHLGAHLIEPRRQPLYVPGRRTARPRPLPYSLARAISSPISSWGG